MLVEGFKGKSVIISWNHVYMLILDWLADTGAPHPVEYKFARKLAAVSLGRGALLVYQRTSPACFRAAARRRHVVELVLT